MLPVPEYDGYFRDGYKRLSPVDRDTCAKCNRKFVPSNVVCAFLTGSFHSHCAPASASKNYLGKFFKIEGRPPSVDTSGTS